MKNLKLTKNEIQECQELFEIFSKDAALLDKKLTAMNMDPATVRNGSGLQQNDQRRRLDCAVLYR